MRDPLVGRLHLGTVPRVRLALGETSLCVENHFGVGADLLRRGLGKLSQLILVLGEERRLGGGEVLLRSIFSLLEVGERLLPGCIALTRQRAIAIDIARCPNVVVVTTARRDYQHHTSANPSPMRI